MRTKHALHIALAERNAGLHQVTASSSWHRHLAHAQLGRDQQAVEAIVVELAGAYGAKGPDQLLGHARHRDVWQGGLFELKILQPRRAAVRPVEAVGPQI